MAVICPARIEPVDPPDAVAALALASQDAIDRDVHEAWCRQVSHFVSRESAEEFAAATTTCYVVGLAELLQAT